MRAAGSNHAKILFVNVFIIYNVHLLFNVFLKFYFNNLEKFDEA